MLQRLYKSHMKMTCFSTPQGRVGRFVEGRFLTDLPDFIEYLDKEIKNGNPHFYVDPAEAEADPKLEDPTERMRSQIRAELIAEMNATNKGNDAGSTELAKLTPQSSLGVESVALGGGASTVQARLAALMKPLQNDTNGA